MKHITKVFALAIVAIGFSTQVNAQATATASASATIVTPISITKTVDLNFGNVGASGVAGTVVISPAGVRSTTGGVSLPATAGTVAAASFDVAGEANYTYAITLPASVTISSGANNMTVNAFTSTPSATGTLSALGAQTVTVGATLNVGASQASGVYTSGTSFDVTVNYN
ncbi:MAG: DUF4402 domain-containing protein [Bacteroidetes bacterium]|nr:DUF4402 domain-containing protein [Bacteroidota bacterium]